MQDLCLADSRILYFWYVLESIQKFIMELHVLQCLFVRRFNKKQRSGRIMSNFTKGETLSSLLTTRCSWGNLIMWSPRKAFLSPSVWPRREYIWTINWNKSLLICFESYQGIPYSHTSRVDRNVNEIVWRVNNLCCLLILILCK